MDRKHAIEMLKQGGVEFQLSGYGMQEPTGPVVRTLPWDGCASTEIQCEPDNGTAPFQVRHIDLLVAMGALAPALTYAHS